MRCTFKVLLLTVQLVTAHQALAQTNGLNGDEIKRMSWRSASGVTLPISNSRIENLSGYVAVTGNDAARIQTMLGNDNNNIEAYIYNPDLKSEATFSYISSGFVNSNDWNDVDANSMLQQVRDATEAANSKRRQIGVSPLHVDGWLQVPTLNQETHTVSWIISDHDDAGERAFNAVALKLGRYGTEKIVFIDNAVHLQSATSNLLLLANAHRFSVGARYEEYVPGTDRAAEYGVAGLVAGVLGVKLVKVAAAAGLLVLLKKAGFLLVFPFIWVWRKIFRKSKVKAPSA